MTARERWKIYYRKLRVIRRESHKAAVDAVMFGSGFMYVPNDGGDPERIHPSEVVLVEDPELTASDIKRRTPKGSACSATILDPLLDRTINILKIER